MLKALLLSLILLAQAPQPPAVGTVQGTVTRVGTAEGLAAVEVALVPVFGEAGARGGASLPSLQAPFAMTDSAGHFEIRNVPAGRYGVRIQSNGYSGAPTNTNLVTITANEVLGLNLSAIPGAIIRGRVLDSGGQFLSNVNVQAFLIVYQNGLPYLQGSVYKLTDDRGEYRLFGIPPGEYYIGVTPRPPLAATTPGSGTERDVRTYFPSTENPETATKITVKGGEQITNVDIGMRSALHVRISGRVISQAPPAAPIRNEPGLPGVFEAIANASNNNARLQLLPRDAGRLAEMDGGPSVSVLMGATPGEFEISNVTPGAYDLFATTTSQSGLALGRVSINVSNQDVTGVTVVIRPGVEVKGSILVDTPPSSAPMGILLQPLGSLLRTGRGFSGLGGLSPGTFSIPRVPEGHFRFTVNVPISHYVEDILQNGRSIYDTGLDVGTNEPDPVQIVLKSGAGTVEGAVVDTADKPVAGATVALVPVNRRDNPSLYRNIVTGQTGNYSLRGIAPGEYKLFAWPAQVNGAFYNTEFLSRYEESGLPITVGVNSKATVKIPLSGQRP